MNKMIILRVAGVLFGGFNAIITLRELVTRPDRDVLIESIGSVVSLHSIYWGLAFVGAGIFIMAGWPAGRWLMAAPYRMKKRRLEKYYEEQSRIQTEYRNEQHRICNTATKLQETLKRMNSRILNMAETIEHNEQIDILCGDLTAAGFGIEIYGPIDDPDKALRIWNMHVSRLLPYLRRDLIQARAKMEEWKK